MIEERIINLIPHHFVPHRSARTSSLKCMLRFGADSPTSSSFAPSRLCVSLSFIPLLPLPDTKNVNSQISCFINGV